MALFCTSGSLLNVWCNLDSHERIQSAALSHLCPSEGNEWKRNAMPWYYASNTFHLADSPGRDSQNPRDGEKSLWQKADLPLATTHSKDPLLLSSAKRHKVVRKGHCVPQTPSRTHHSQEEEPLCSRNLGQGARDVNLRTVKSNATGEQLGCTAF